MFQPVLYLLLFAPLLNGLNGVPGFPPGGAYTVFTPGLLVMLALFTTAFAGFGLVDQIRNGFVERLLVTPASRLAILAGLPGAGRVVLLVQSVIAVAAGRAAGPDGEPPGPAGLTFGLMVLTGALMASCSYALALLLKREDTLASVINTVATPLMLLSGITLPLTLAPKIIRSIASVNPFAYEVTASRCPVPGQLLRSGDHGELWRSSGPGRAGLLVGHPFLPEGRRVASGSLTSASNLPKFVARMEKREKLGAEIRFLGRVLGEVIKEQAGPALFDLEEEIRLGARARREGRRAPNGRWTRAHPVA